MYIYYDCSIEFDVLNVISTGRTAFQKRVLGIGSAPGGKFLKATNLFGSENK